MKKYLFKLVLLTLTLSLLGWGSSAQAATIAVGNDTSQRDHMDDYSNFCIIDTNHPVSANGWLTLFKYYAFNQNPFRFILVDGGNKVQWVSDEITPAAAGVRAYAPATAVQVQAGWNLGVYFVYSSIPFEPMGAPAFYTKDNSGLPRVGRTLTYAGSVGRTYSFGATGSTEMTPPPQSVNVTIIKYLDGSPASAASANNSYFLMKDSWNDPNVGSGSGRFSLGPEGVNTTNPYQAVTTASMTTGSSYTIGEETGQYAVGTTCGNGQAYRLNGYTVGDTLAQAAAATPSLTEPNLTLTGSKYVIVWNSTCAQTETIVAGNDTYGTDFRPIVDTYGYFLIVDTNHPVSANGWLTQFHYYAVNPYLFRFFLVDGNDVVQWVSDAIIPPDTGAQIFTPSSPVTVREGWNVGLYFASTGRPINGTIPYEYTGAPAFYRSDNSGSPLPEIGRALVYEGSSNRIYSFAATGVATIPMPETVTVTVVKYLDGTRADAVSADGTSYPMNAAWKATNISPGSGSGSFVLGPADANNTNPYQATTPAMATGASYSVSEDTSQPTVGTTCDNGALYQLVGYTSGDTLVQAVAAQQTTTAPSLNNIVSDKYIIVWNKTCAATDDCDNNGHHKGNDKGDQHKCKSNNNGNHYGENK